jgi:hypothetical protein
MFISLTPSSVLSKTAKKLPLALQKPIESNEIVQFPHCDIGLKSKAEVLLTKALKKACEGFGDRYRMDKAQIQIAKIVKTMNGLKTYEEGVSPVEFSPQAIVEKGFSFLV